MARGRQKLDALATGEWTMASTEVAGPGLNFYAADGWSRIGMAWTADFSAFHGWYVNFQLPLVRSCFGFDTMDLVLDARVSPAWEWSWKDEDDFAEALDRGILDRSIEQALRADAETLASLLDDRAGPFHPKWLAWRPSGAYGIPTLPADAIVA